MPPKKDSGRDMATFLNARMSTVVHLHRLTKRLQVHSDAIQSTADKVTGSGLRHRVPKNVVARRMSAEFSQNQWNSDVSIKTLGDVSIKAPAEKSQLLPKRPLSRQKSRRVRHQRLAQAYSQRALLIKGAKGGSARNVRLKTAVTKHMNTKRFLRHPPSNRFSIYAAKARRSSLEGIHGWSKLRGCVVATPKLLQAVKLAAAADLGPSKNQQQKQQPSIMMKTLRDRFDHRHTSGSDHIIHAPDDKTQSIEVR